MSIIKKFITKFIFLLFVVLIGSLKVQGQAARSPFSTFGLGEPYGNSLIQHQGMGGIGVSQPQLAFLNNANPALLVYNTVTVFQAGMVGESRTIKSDTLSETSRGGNLNYLVTAFPILPFRYYQTKWTTSVGLMPFSKVDYGIQFEEYSRNSAGQIIDTLNVLETGAGGLTQFYWSNGVRITDQFSIGLKTAYIFGPIETLYSNQTTNPDQAVPYLIQVREKTNIKDFQLTAGASFTRDSLGRKNNYRISAGGTYSVATKMNASKRNETRRIDARDGTTLESDTLFTTGGYIRIPGSLTLGLSLSKGSKWTIGTEFNYQDWSAFESISQDDEGLGQAWRASVGTELTPDMFAYENYLKRVTYRVGFTYENYPFVVNGKQVKDFGINFGFSLPAGRSSLDLAFKVGKRGDRAENVLEESYFKVYFGLTFNDQWFIKRKFD